MRCIELAINNPPLLCEYRVFNQFTEQFSVLELAKLVEQAGGKLGLNVAVEFIGNPRMEKDSHYFNAAHTKLLDLGLQPHYLSNSLLDSMLKYAIDHRDSVDRSVIQPRVNWRSTTNMDKIDSTRRDKSIEASPESLELQLGSDD